MRGDYKSNKLTGSSLCFLLFFIVTTSSHGFKGIVVTVDSDSNTAFVSCCPAVLAPIIFLLGVSVAGLTCRDDEDL